MSAVLAFLLMVGTGFVMVGGAYKLGYRQGKRNGYDEAMDDVTDEWLGLSGEGVSG